MTNEKVLSRVKKLLALADKEKNTSEAEAFAAMLKAQEILLANGLTMDDVSEVDDTGKKEVAEEFVPQPSAGFPNWKMIIVATLCKNFRVTPVKVKRGRGTSIQLIGLKEDVAVCKEVLLYAFNSFEKLFKAYLKQWKKDNAHVPTSYTTSLGVKNDYLAGFCRGLDEKFKEQVTEMALVVVQDDAVVERLREMNLSKGRPIQNNVRRGDDGAFRQGYTDAKSLSRHQAITD